MSLLRVSRSSIASLAPGDILVIVAFVLVGEFSHGVLPWTVPVLVAETTLTFLVGWVAVAPLTWAYQRRNLSSPPGAAATAFLAWVGAAAVANLIRSTSLVHGNGSVTFYLVSVAAGGAMLAGWRYLRVRPLVS